MNLTALSLTCEEQEGIEAVLALARFRGDMKMTRIEALAEWNSLSEQDKRNTLNYAKPILAEK